MPLLQNHTLAPKSAASDWLGLSNRDQQEAGRYGRSGEGGGAIEMAANAPPSNYFICRRAPARLARCLCRTLPVGSRCELRPAVC